MPLADSNGPRWARRQHVDTEKRLAGTGPIRRFLAVLFGGPPGFGAAGRATSSSGIRRPDGDIDPGAAGAGRTAPLLPQVPTLAGSAARNLEDAGDD